MIDLDRIRASALSREPYDWAFVTGLFSEANARTLAATYPLDHFKPMRGYDSEKGWEYEVRSLIGMGATTASHAGALSAAWRELAQDLLSREYREAMARLTGLALQDLPVEANVFHYPSGAWQGPHRDLADKVVTHVLYFNESWRDEDGGRLAVLRSSQLEEMAASIAPVVGNSSVIVRSETSWHAVTRVGPRAPESRRSVTVTFYRPGSVSTMWPPGDRAALGDHGSRRGGGGLRSWIRSRLGVSR